LLALVNPCPTGHGIRRGFAAVGALASGGFLYLVMTIDWYSRYVLAWWLSPPDSPFCLEMLEEVLGKGQPEVFNTDIMLF